MFGQYADTARAIARISADLERRDDRFAGPVGTVAYPSRTAGRPDHILRVVVSRRDGIAGPAGTAYMTCNCDAQTRGFRMCYAMADASYIFGGTVVPIHAGLHRGR
jgi:hypothetical protein